MNRTNINGLMLIPILLTRMLSDSMLRVESLVSTHCVGTNLWDVPASLCTNTKRQRQLAIHRRGSVKKLRSHGGPREQGVSYSPNQLSLSFFPDTPKGWKVAP